MQTGRTKLAASFIAVLTLSAPAALPAPASKLSGSIAGYVRSVSGVPQMGATVLLFNRSERMIQRALTNERGIFGFEALKPDTYSVRVSLASFMPAVKHSIVVQPGMQSLLYVDLASVLSSIELVYATPGQGALMSDDWKWTLKGSAATRAVLRALPDGSTSDPEPGPAGAVLGNARVVECFGWRSGLLGQHVRASGFRHGFRGGHFVSWAATSFRSAEMSATAKAKPCHPPASAPAIAAMG